MHFNCKNITGQRFGRLTVVSPAERRNVRGCIVWQCICECGKEVFVNSNNLSSGDTKSCGCLLKERIKNNKFAITHGMHNTAEYRAWQQMIQRCENPNYPNFQCWGGRGITVCDRWHNSFEAFYKDMGKRPVGLGLDRWPNNDGNYEPGNCRWATRKQQANNRRVASCGPCKQHWFRAWREDMMCQFVIKSQIEFARKHNLIPGAISFCLSGKRKQHKGWFFEKI